MICACCLNGEARNTYRIFGRNPVGNLPLGRPRGITKYYDVHLGIRYEEMRSSGGFWYIFYHGRTALVGLGLLHEVPQSHSLVLLCTSDRPVAETSVYLTTHNTRDRHPCTHRDSNPSSQKLSGRRPTP